MHAENNKKIAFHIPWITGMEVGAMDDAITRNGLSSDGFYTQSCICFMKQKYKFPECLLTNSCTAALELIALLINTNAHDEIIVPSYTFVTTANAFAAQGAKIIFADVMSDHPQVDLADIRSKITKKTKAIVVVHYAGYSYNMSAYQELAREYNIILIEDAAQCIDSFDGDQKAFGTFGDFATFSFHETKNIHCGEGGLLVINNPQYVDRAHTMYHKGTNRKSFIEKKVASYEWVDLGRSFAISELQAAFLYPQLKNTYLISDKRRKLWHAYHDTFNKLELSFCTGMRSPDSDDHNAHIYYIVMRSIQSRNDMITYLNLHDIEAKFHYQALETSEYARQYFPGQLCPNSQNFSNCLLRLPLHDRLSIEDISYICSVVSNYIPQ